MSSPRGLTPGEAEAWERLASTVEPLGPPRKSAAASAPRVEDRHAPGNRPAKAIPKPTAPPRQPATPPPAPQSQSLNSHWERHLSRSSTEPDFTLDLHGHTLDQAYRRLDAGLLQAKAMDARLVLVVTGKSRPVDAADRGTKRGAIRAKILDWLAAGQHASDIAAVKTAHRRHGGDGALYLVLRRRR